MFSFFKKKPPSPPANPATRPATGSPAGPATGAVATPMTQAPGTVAGGSLIGRALVTPIQIPVPAAIPPERQKWLEKLKSGLGKTASSISGVFGGTQINETLFEDLESALLMADAGVPATEHLIAELRRKVKDTGITHPVALKNALIASLTALLQPLEKPLVIGENKPTVIMVVGVNGAGKTTSIGKLTRHLAIEGASVLLAAADTFRAAAREQLTVWADRNTVEIISQQGGDPAAVSFDAVTAGKARGKDVVLVDTAGRLPTQIHLMDELKKIKRVIQKADASAPHEVLLVIDGNTGQNALTQVKAFDDALGLTGLIVTKLDGTAKGGVLAAIARGRAIPVYFIGVGEKLEELETFSAREFAQALLA
jgi:fused signal recognition particle receptor